MCVVFERKRANDQARITHGQQGVSRYLQTAQRRDVKAGFAMNLLPGNPNLPPGATMRDICGPKTDNERECNCHPDYECECGMYDRDDQLIEDEEVERID